MLSAFQFANNGIWGAIRNKRLLVQYLTACIVYQCLSRKESKLMSGPWVQDSTQVSVRIFRMHYYDACYIAALFYPFLPQDNPMNI